MICVWSNTATVAAEAEASNSCKNNNENAKQSKANNKKILLLDKPAMKKINETPVFNGHRGAPCIPKLAEEEEKIAL